MFMNINKKNTTSQVTRIARECTLLLFILTVVFAIFYHGTHDISEHIKKMFYMQYAKVVILVVSIVFILIINLKSCSKKCNTIILCLNIVMSLLIAYYMPMHAAFGIDYNTTHNPNIIDDDVAFIGISDPQLFGNNLERRQKNLKLIDGINLYIKDNSPDVFTGIIISGDCTQTNEDGRFIFSNNYIGDFEYMYGLNCNDHILKLPVYECLGNHDYENKHWFYYGNPALDMIKRRNMNRDFILDDDKYGNYAFLVNKSHIMFCINLWPTDKLSLEGYKVRGGVKFIRNILLNHPKSKWSILTHYIPSDIRSGQIKDEKRLPRLRSCYHKT